MGALVCVVRLNSSDVDGEPMFIQMVTALVLQLIQCVVHLPSQKDHDDEYDKKVRGQPRGSITGTEEELSLTTHQNTVWEEVLVMA